MPTDEPGTPSMIVYQLALPHYRQAMLDHLATSAPRILFRVGDQQFYAGVNAGVTGDNVESTGTNVFVLGRRVGWQKVSLRESVSARVVVLELNPRLLNSWAVLMLRKLLRKPTFFWGHVFPRAGAASRTEALRKRMRGLADGMIVYTEEERQSYLSMHSRKRVEVAANAIYSGDMMKPLTSSEASVRFVVIGRLVSDKKPALAVEAFAAACARMPGARLTIVGEGAEQQRVEAMIRAQSLEDRVELTGEVTSYDELREIFADAVALVAPGYVGLNVTQSLGFGVPVIYALEEPHAPEVEVLDEENSKSFEANNAKDLSDLMVAFWDQRVAWRERRDELSSSTRARYSAEVMASAFMTIASSYNE